jgi:hypothetical protein
MEIKSNPRDQVDIEVAGVNSIGCLKKSFTTLKEYTNL